MQDNRLSPHIVALSSGEWPDGWLGNPLTAQRLTTMVANLKDIMRRRLLVIFSPVTIFSTLQFNVF